MSIQNALGNTAAALAERAITPDQIKAMQAHIISSMNNNTLEAYKAVPILQDLNNRLQQIQNAPALAQATVQQPPISAQVVQQARADLQGQQPQAMPQQPPMPQAAPQPPMPQGIDAAQSNLPTEGYAPGGIIAFAPGGMTDPVAEDEQYGGMGREELSVMDAIQGNRDKLSNMSSPSLDLDDASAAGAMEDEPIDDELFAPEPEKAEEDENALSSTAYSLGEPSSGINVLVDKPKTKESTFNKALSFILPHEGGLSTNKADKGGITNYGITRSTLEAYLGHPVTEKEMKNLSPELAQKIYKEKYWDAIGGDNLDPKVAVAAFDAAVQHGPAYANKLLKNTGGDVDAMLAARSDKYNKIVQNDPTQRVFARGWNNRLNDLSGYVSTLAQGGIAQLATGGASDDNWVDPETMVMQKPTSNPIVPDPIGDYFRAGAQRRAAQEQQLANKIRGIPEGTEYDLTPPAARTAENALPTPAMDSGIPKYDEFDLTPNIDPLKAAQEAAAPAAPLAPPASTTPSSEEKENPYMKMLMDSIGQSKADLAGDKSLTPWLALAQAGLGIMGGTSPNFGANIGAGGEKGVAALVALNNKNQEAQKEINAALLGATRADLLNRSHKETVDARLAMMGVRDKEFGQTLQLHKDQLQNLAAYQANMLGVRGAANINSAIAHQQNAFNAAVKAKQYDLANFWNGSPEQVAAKKYIDSHPTEFKTDADAQRYMNQAHNAHMINTYGIDPTLIGTSSGIPKSTER